LKPAEAYALSLRELSIYIDGARAAELTELKREIDHAWLIAMLNKTDPKKFPEHPSKFYPAPPLTRKQRAQQNAARMRALANARNASLKKKSDPPPVVRRRKKEK